MWSWAVKTIPATWSWACSEDDPSDEINWSTKQWMLSNTHIHMWTLTHESCRCHSMYLHTSGWSACFTLCTHYYALFLIITSSHMCMMLRTHRILYTTNLQGPHVWEAS